VAAREAELVEAARAFAEAVADAERPRPRDPALDDLVEDEVDGADADHPRCGRAADRAAPPRQGGDDGVPDPAVAGAAHPGQRPHDPGARRGAVHPERDETLALQPGEHALALAPD